MGAMRGGGSANDDRAPQTPYQRQAAGVVPAVARFAPPRVTTSGDVSPLSVGDDSDAVRKKGAASAHLAGGDPPCLENGTSFEFGGAGGAAAAPAVTTRGDAKQALWYSTV